MVYVTISAIAFFFLSLVLGGCRDSGVTEPLSSAPPPPATALADEGWESSGGSGVACFASEEEAKQADAVLAHRGSLDDEMRRRVVSLVTLDRWEYEGRMHFARATPLEVVEARFRRHTPIFSTRLNLLKTRIDLSQWEDGAALPKVEDIHLATPVETVAPKCRLIQLAVRKSKSVAGKLPVVSVAFDRWLFENRLDVLDRDMLKLHEWFYLVGREINHHNSDVIRMMVAHYFSDEFGADLVRRLEEERLARAHGRVSVGVHHPGRLVSDPIYESFGDYFQFFVSDPLDQPREIPSRLGQFSRYASFGRLLTLLRDRKGDCLAKRGIRQTDPPSKKMARAMKECSDIAVDPKELEPLLDSEQSFLFLADYALTYTRALETFEHLVIWNREDPGAIDEFQGRQVAGACLGLEDVDRNAFNPPFDLSDFRPLIPAAQNYCAQLGLPYRH